MVEDIVDKLAVKHDVDLHEVREILKGRPLFRRMERGHRPGEDLYGAFGQTDSGRYLVVFFVLKKDNKALVISARDMSFAERRSYEQR